MLDSSAPLPPTGRRLLLACVGLALAACVQGCSDPGASSDRVVHPVTGKVVLADGKPLTAGMVVFVSNERAMEFEAPLDSQGAFAIETSYGRGAPEGEYQVRIEPAPDQWGEAKVRGKKGGDALPFPGKYTDEDTSGLVASIKAGDNALAPFKLTK